MTFPSTKTIKKLFALSGNTCAFPKCSTPLIDAESGSVIGEICHIKARKSDGARYDISQTDKQRNAFENLIILCPTHHKIIDDDYESYSVERLQQIKTNHESNTLLPLHLTAEQEKIEKIIENYLISVIKKTDFQVKHKESEKKEVFTETNLLDSFLREEEILIAKRKSEIFRNTWFNSEIGCRDVANSVKNIFNLIYEKYSLKSEVFLTKGIKLLKDENSISIQTDKYGCSVRIVNFKLNNIPAIIPKNTFLEIFLFEKQIIYQDIGAYITEQITRICLKPDIDDERQIFWRDLRDKTKIFTLQEICNECFELLIRHLKNHSNVETKPYSKT